MKTALKPLAVAGLLTLCAAAFSAPSAAPAALAVPIPSADQILQTLRKEHPRLLATAKEFAQLRQQVKTDAPFQQMHLKLREQANRILKQPPSKYEIPDGLRLLSTSRRVLYRVQVLAMLYQLEGDTRYVERAWQELDAAANFPDWNTRHFLDTAEMTHAFAIGYDWLFEAWTEPQRAALRTAMIEKGIKPAWQVHEQARWWAKARHNWNQVCNGGIGMGALALADSEPDLAGKFLHAALLSLQLPMAEFAPDGAWAEGPGYWNYATSYNVVLLAALQTALGTDFGLSKMEGFSEAGMFPIYMAGPLGNTFNYADAGSGPLNAPQMFWMARQFHRPAYAAYQRSQGTSHPLDLLWYDLPGDASALAALPLAKYFRYAEVATFRSAWNDRDALFVGLKAGDNQANHSHLDLGSFVLDALGTRWAADLGSDDYNLPGYFGKQRWTYYRLRAEGHNTLVINPDKETDQVPSAVAKIVKFSAQPNRAFAITDLTPAYARDARNVRRGLALLDRTQVLVQDEVQTDKPSQVWWFLHTSATAQASSDGRTATLTRGNARLLARIVSPAKAAFSIMDAAPLSTSPQPEKQATNNQVRKLAIELRDVQDLRLAVLLTPLREGETASPKAPALSALAEW